MNPLLKTACRLGLEACSFGLSALAEKVFHPGAVTADRNLKFNTLNQAIQNKNCIKTEYLLCDVIKNYGEHPVAAEAIMEALYSCEAQFEPEEYLLLMRKALDVSKESVFRSGLEDLYENFKKLYPQTVFKRPELKLVSKPK